MWNRRYNLIIRKKIEKTDKFLDKIKVVHLCWKIAWILRKSNQSIFSLNKCTTFYIHLMSDCLMTIMMNVNYIYKFKI